jgi:hypothetical protein
MSVCGRFGFVDSRSRTSWNAVERLPALLHLQRLPQQEGDLVVDLPEAA